VALGADDVQAAELDDLLVVALGLVAELDDALEDAAREPLEARAIARASSSRCSMIALMNSSVSES
jgi:hypothetical protein